MEVMLNPPKKAKKSKKAKASKKRRVAAKRRRKSILRGRFCVPKRLLRKAKSLKRLKSAVFHPGKQVCMPKSVIAKARSLKKLKHRYAGVKYGFARRKKSSGGFAQGLLPFGKPERKVARAKRSPGKKYSYMDIIALSPLERETRGITAKHTAIAGKRGHVYVKGGGSAESTSTGFWPSGGEIAANPRRTHRFNYTVPVYAFNSDANIMSMDGLKNGVMAGYKPSTIMTVVPVVGGLVANSIVAGYISKMVTDKLALSDTMKGPAKLGIGLLSAGLLSMATKMVAPRYAQHVFLGGMAQTLWDGYQTYLQPLVKKYTGLGRCHGIGCSDEPDLTFGLYCPECAEGLNETLNDFLSPGQVAIAQPVISEAVNAAIPAADAAMQAPPMPSAPLTAKVNGKEVVVEKIVSQPSGTSGFGDFLTPNQVAQASPLGDFGSL